MVVLNWREWVSQRDANREQDGPFDYGLIALKRKP